MTKRSEKINEMEEILKCLYHVSANQDHVMTIVHTLVMNFSKLKKDLAAKNIDIDCDLNIEEVIMH